MDCSRDPQTTCEICETFVSGLERLYSLATANATRVDDFAFDWSFRDISPVFSRLRQSANQGCRWCTFLDGIVLGLARSFPHLLPSSMKLIELGNRPKVDELSMSITFHAVSRKGSRGPLEGFRHLRCADLNVWEYGPSDSGGRRDLQYQGHLPIPINIDIIDNDGMFAVIGNSTFFTFHCSMAESASRIDRWCRL